MPQSTSQHLAHTLFCFFPVSCVCLLYHLCVLLCLCASLRVCVCEAVCCHLSCLTLSSVGIVLLLHASVAAYLLINACFCVSCMLDYPKALVTWWKILKVQCVGFSGMAAIAGQCFDIILHFHCVMRL